MFRCVLYELTDSKLTSDRCNNDMTGLSKLCTVVNRYNIRFDYAIIVKMCSIQQYHTRM